MATRLVGASSLERPSSDACHRLRAAGTIIYSSNASGDLEALLARAELQHAA